MTRVSGSTLRRFESADIDPSKFVDLRADHPALAEGRTLFPSTVVKVAGSPRFLVSGVKSPKLGKQVLKGPREGWPIFQLTLEERATCPRSCEQWAGCYGNAMPFARRHDHTELDFWPTLRSEIITLCRAHPKGLLIRLHVLGDFYSVGYVHAWAVMLSQYPQLHVFGYTARTILDPDPESAKIARAIQVLTDGCWDRFAIRTSGSSGARSAAIVVDEDPQAANVIICPAQTKATEACATCGLCWAARDKTIAFLRHGMTRERGPRAVAQTVTPKPPKPEPRPQGRPVTRASDGVPALAGQMSRTVAAISAGLNDGGALTISLKGLAEAADVPLGSMIFVLRNLCDAGKIAIERNGPREPHTYRLTAIVPPSPPSPAPLAPAAKPKPPVAKIALPAVAAPVPRKPPLASDTDPIDAVVYLRRKGHTAIYMGAGKWRLDEKPCGFELILGAINIYRQRLSIPPLAANMVAIPREPAL